MMLTAERRRTVLAECLEAGAVGWIGVTTPLDEVDSTLSRVLAGGSIIGRTDRAELLDHLRLERASLAASASDVRTVDSPRSPARSRPDRRPQRRGDRPRSLRSADHSPLADPCRLQKLGVRSQLAAVALADTHRELLPYASSAARDRRRSAPRSIGSAARPTPFAPPDGPLRPRRMTGIRAERCSNHRMLAAYARRITRGTARPRGCRRSAAARTSNAGAVHVPGCT